MSSKHAGCVLKILSDNEYSALKHLQNSNLRDFCPELYGITQIHGMDYLVVQNLLHGMKDPKIMDIKMGTRTFELSEFDKPEQRMDLLDKMIAMDPTAPTDEERVQGITKLRFVYAPEISNMIHVLICPCLSLQCLKIGWNLPCMLSKCREHQHRRQMSHLS
jgi:hypothetical protein